MKEHIAMQWYKMGYAIVYHFDTSGRCDSISKWSSSDEAKAHGEALASRMKIPFVDLRYKLSK